ncbi:MAG: hypothetical protein KGY70_13095 [Bacteroidales bacterium]|nr:hypothetical protein [Bacteroidales bacterium]
MKILWHISTTETQHNSFKSGHLINKWAGAHPEIFDEDDLRLAREEAKYGYKFYEWMAAVIIYNTIGYFSLMKEYELTSHERKHEAFKQIVDPKTFQYIMAPKEEENYCPDLFCYSVDIDDWFFCDVKGKEDEWNLDRLAFFKNLKNITGKEVRLVTIDKQSTVRESGGIAFTHE